jgi:hypothetical protein
MINKKEVFNLYKDYFCQNEELENCYIDCDVDSCPVSKRSELLRKYLEEQTNNFYTIESSYSIWLNKSNISAYNKKGEWSKFALDIENIDKFIEEYNEKFKNETIKNLHETIKNLYPNAVSIKLFINYYSIEVAPEYRINLDGISMKTLSGEWVK